MHGFPGSGLARLGKCGGGGRREDPVFFFLVPISYIVLSTFNTPSVSTFFCFCDQFLALFKRVSHGHFLFCFLSLSFHFPSLSLFSHSPHPIIAHQQTWPPKLPSPISQTNGSDSTRFVTHFHSFVFFFRFKVQSEKVHCNQTTNLV